MYKNKFTILIPLIVAGSIVIGILCSGLVFRRDSIPPMRRPGLMSTGAGKINTLLSLIENRYVDTVSMDSLTEKIMPLIVEELDPHSTYVSAKDMAAVNESLDAQFDGIGIKFNMITDTILVLNVIPDGPSSRAGVLGGDRIVTIDDRIVAGVKMSSDSVMKQLRGPRGTEVKLGIRRGEGQKLVPVTVTRDVIPIKSIPAAYMIAPEIGYVVFSEFSRNAHRELVATVEQLQKEGMKKLILDIRGNPGGFLDQAILISNEFLLKDKMIVYTRDRSGSQTSQYSNGQGRFQNLELAVLIDEHSASSSEILAGALQDNDRGILIGRRSFGKGLVQEQIPFRDGSAVRLTVSRYYTPSGRSIQKPYRTGASEAYYNELMERYEHREYFSADSIRFADSLKYSTVDGRVVYGGGGIMPDIFVPVDTTDITPYFRKISEDLLIFKFTIDYSDHHREELNAITSLEQLDALFAKDPSLFNRFVNYAAKAGVAPAGLDIALSRNLISAQLKAYIGRNTSLEENAFYYEIQEIDPVVHRTLEVMRQKQEDV